MKGVLFMKKQEIDVAENALTALARMTLDDLLDLVVQKMSKNWTPEERRRSPHM